MTETQRAVNRLMNALAVSAGELLVRSAIWLDRSTRTKKRIIKREKYHALKIYGKSPGQFDSIVLQQKPWWQDADLPLEGKETLQFI